MRRKRPGFLWRVGYRLRKGAPTGAVTFAVVFGVGSSVVTVTGMAATWLTAAASGAAGLLIGTAAAYAQARTIHIPDVVTPGDDGHSTCTSVFSTPAQLVEANQIASLFYGADSLSDDQVRLWQMHNKSVFVSILNASSEVIAAFGVVPLREQFAQEFIAGRLVEADIQPEDILRQSESRTSKWLYVSGVVVRDPDTVAGSRRTLVMLWVMVKYLRKLYGTRTQRHLLALAATKEGERLLQRLGFKVVSAAGSRKDHHNLYARDLDDSALEEIERLVGDCGPMCTCRF